MYRSGLVYTLVSHANMKGLGLTPFFRDSRGFMPPQLKIKTNKLCKTTPSTNSLDEVPRPPAAPRDRPRGFLVLASSADALENCELTVTFEALEKPEILEIVDRGMVVNLTLSTQILN